MVSIQYSLQRTVPFNNYWWDDHCNAAGSCEFGTPIFPGRVDNSPQSSALADHQKLRSEISRAVFEFTTETGADDADQTTCPRYSKTLRTSNDETDYK